MKKSKLNSPANCYKQGGQIKPLVVSDPNDKRLKAYQDSLKYFNQSAVIQNVVRNRYPNSKYIISTDDVHDMYDGQYPKNMQPLGTLWAEQGKGGGTGAVIHKKPVQPVVYQPQDKIPESLKHLIGSDLMYPIQDTVHKKFIQHKVAETHRGFDPSPQLAQTNSGWDKPPIDYILGPNGRINKTDYDKQSWMKASNQKFQGGGQINIDSTLLANKKVPFVDRILNADKYPVRYNSDPNKDLNYTYSTHVMSDGEADGNYYAYPTLRYLPTSKKWLDNTKDSKKALGVALEDNDVIKFNNQKDASYFSQHYKDSKLSKIPMHPNQINKHPKFSLGGTVGSLMQTAAPFTTAIPGFGLPLSIGLGLGGNMLSQYSQQQNMKNQQPMYANGGQITNNSMDNKVMINVEGPKRRGGKVELEVTPEGKVVRNFANYPPHPNLGTNKAGDTLATINNVIIPKNLSKQFLEGDKMFKSTTISNLSYKQSLRDKQEKKFSTGGLVGDEYLPKYPTGFDPISSFEGNNKQSWMPWNNSSIARITENPDMSISNSNDPRNYLNTNVPTSSATEPPTPHNQRTNLSSALPYLPAAYNIGRGLFDKPSLINEGDYQVKDKLQFPNLTGEAGRKQLREGYAGGKYALKMSGQNSMAGLNNLNNNYSSQVGKFNENLENINKQGQYQANVGNIENMFRNKQIGLHVKEYNQQVKGVKDQFLSKGITNLGQASNQSTEEDWINKMFPDGVYNSGGKRWNHKTKTYE